MKAEEARAGVEELQRGPGPATAPPHVIECYDISNISGTHAVGSMVCAVDGMPARNRYRQFRIKTVEGHRRSRHDGRGDPPTVHRRAARSSSALPDLVIVDGGITQLRAARRGTGRPGTQPRCPRPAWPSDSRKCTGRPTAPPPPLRFRDGSARPVRAEADPGRGPSLRPDLSPQAAEQADPRVRASTTSPASATSAKQQLLQHFGSIRRLEKAPGEEIAAVPGIGREMAEAILSTLGGSE